MSRFESIAGQEKSVRILAILLRRGKVPHALLFSGIDDAGKLAAARTFAMACNCLNRPVQASQNTLPEASVADANPCGDCISCRKIQSGQHPDVLTVSPAKPGSIIRISQIRSLCEILSLKPYEARQRVVIIADAQTMNPEAANALLKLLEEPPERSIFIVLAPQASDLLPTIGSRCQQVHFHPLPREELRALLMEKEGLPPEEAAAIAVLAGGSYARALLLSKPLKDTDWTHWRNWLLRASGLERPGELPQRPAGALLLFAEQLASNKEILPEALEVLKAWLRDLIIFKFCPEKIINRDLAGIIADVSAHEPVAALLSKIETIQTAQRTIRANTNARLAIEAMMLKMAC